MSTIQEQKAEREALKAKQVRIEAELQQPGISEAERIAIYGQIAGLDQRLQGLDGRIAVLVPRNEGGWRRWLRKAADYTLRAACTLFIYYLVSTALRKHGQTQDEAITGGILAAVTMGPIVPTIAELSGRAEDEN